jgi:hypothetical protein
MCYNALMEILYILMVIGIGWSMWALEDDCQKDIDAALRFWLR